MKEKFLRIESFRGDTVNRTSVFLLTGNVTGYIYEAETTRVYFKTAIPFSFILLHMSIDVFERLVNSTTAAIPHCSEIIKDGIKFRYTIFQR
jgi:hypothetical protein